MSAVILCVGLRWQKDGHFVTRADEVHELGGYVFGRVLGSLRRCEYRVTAEESLVELGFSQIGVDEADRDALGRKLCSGDGHELIEGGFR